jgi:hypothetical protein
MLYRQLNLNGEHYQKLCGLGMGLQYLLEILSVLLPTSHPYAMGFPLSSPSKTNQLLMNNSLEPVEKVMM